MRPQRKNRLTMCARLCYSTIRAARSGLFKRAEKREKPFSAPPCKRRDWKEEVKILYAIIETGSKQYKVSEGDVLKVEKLDAEVGAEVEFPVVMISADDGVKIGEEVKNAKVSAKVEAQDKFKKIIVFKYKAKKNERKKQGHRQPFTAVKIEKITL